MPEVETVTLGHFQKGLSLAPLTPEEEGGFQQSVSPAAFGQTAAGTMSPCTHSLRQWLILAVSEHFVRCNPIRNPTYGAYIPC